MQVFKVAKVMAPSVIYIDEIEKVLVHSNTILFSFCHLSEGELACQLFLSDSEMNGTAVCVQAAQDWQCNAINKLHDCCATIINCIQRV